ncbi:MAG: hypothetical protein N2V74_00755 [Candidatus Methanospirare jalkutatii]|nr:MAG: hypothetical protein N2V74_05105 [Candidatus Methanospirare jalkutatii]UYZ40261.1 MAG: hypothetical protein N2V74_00755 [Candidatus Methanospirare jalkutatii]
MEAIECWKNLTALDTMDAKYKEAERGEKMEAKLITWFVVIFGITAALFAIGWFLIDFIISLIAVIHPLIVILISIFIIMLVGYVFSVLIEFIVKIGDAESELNEKKHESAREKTEEAKKLAKKSIKEANLMLDKAYTYGHIDASVLEIMREAMSAFYGGRYEVAIKHAEECKKFIMEWEGKAKPEVEVDMPLKEYKPNYWKRTKFILKNKGKAHARDVEIELSDVVSAGLVDRETGRMDKVVMNLRSRRFYLSAGEKREIDVILKPKEEGEVPLRVKLRYKDLKGREYESEQVFLINVSDAEREESEEGRKEPLLINIERGIYDPCKGGFLEGEFRRMKEWVNRQDPYAYWLVLSIQNKTGKAIEEWGVELETSSALKFEEARVEGVEYAIKVYESHPEPFRSRYAVGIPKEYGIFIPDGGSHRIYLKMRAEKPKTEYEIRGVFKYAGVKVPVRPKRFKYLCDARTDAEALRVELEKIYTKRDAARLALAFKIIQEMDRMCERSVAKTGEFLEKLSLLKDYTEGLSGKFTKQVEEFARFMKEEQFEYLDEKYKMRVKNLCTRLIDIWISEFLK